MEKPEVYAYGEAFCLMWYVCTTVDRTSKGQGCSHRERIWNSRDGITPMGTNCPSCGEGMLHSYFTMDEQVPEHKLYYGQKFWRDGTPDEAEAIMLTRIKLNQDKFPVDEEYKKRLIKDAREGVDSSGLPNEFSPGWPVLDIYLKED